MLLNCGAGEDSWESLGPKEIQPVHLNGDQSWVFIGRTEVEAETPIFWPPDVKSGLLRKRPWCWEELGAGGEGDKRGWDGWMASLTRWTRVWVDSSSWWWTGSLVCCVAHGVAKSRTQLSDWTELEQYLCQVTISIYKNIQPFYKVFAEFPRKILLEYLIATERSYCALTVQKKT